MASATFILHQHRTSCTLYFRNILAVLAGIVAGWIVNMGLIVLTAKLMPPPAGVDVNGIASINAHIPRILVRAVADALSRTCPRNVRRRVRGGPFRHFEQLVLALTLGVFFLLGGIVAVSA